MALLKATFAVLLAAVFTGCSGCDSGPDYSRAVEKVAVPSPQYPLAGFWKWDDASQDGAGVAISPAGNGFYSITFCGSVADFRPGEWADNSKIYGDPGYKVIDMNTIEMQGQGNVWSRLYRFASRTTTQPVAPVNPSWH